MLRCAVTSRGGVGPGRSGRQAAGAALLLAAPVLLSCRPDGGGAPPPGSPRASFTEVTAAAGLDDSPPVWPDGRYQIPEINVGGLALFDWDGDGDLDIYQVCHPPPDRPGAPAPNRLFAQEPAGVFREVPGAAGLDDPGYGNGVATADVDGDGHADVYVANLGADALYVSDGAGKFRDATAAAGIRDTGWSTGAAFLDYDRDGDLDLYVSHYLVDDPTRVCRPEIGGRQDYCGPARFQGAPDTLWRNEGDGTFADASRAAGLRGALPGFGVLAIDLTLDGWTDIFVANDMQPNLLYVNQRNGTFREEGVARGAALNGAGAAQAGMGVAAGDANGDGLLDLFVTNLADQTNTLYLAAAEPAARGTFRDRSATSGLGAPSLPFTGWGCAFADFDHDGDLDLAVVNGRVARGRAPAPGPAPALGPFWNDYAEPNLLFWNDGGGRFAPTGAPGSPAAAGAFTARAEVTHSLACGDLDGDGDLDLATTGVGNRLRLYRNDAPAPGTHWLRVRALTGKRDALGALVAVTAGGRRQVRPLITAYSYAAASEPVAHFGLGAATAVERIEVDWPDGRRERFPAAGVDRLVVLREGEGEPPQSP